MDGRWKLVVAGGMFAGAVGCSSTPKQPDNAMSQSSAMASAQVAKAPPPPAEPKRTNLKPETYVSMGTLADAAADEEGRTPAERNGFRLQARQSYQKAIAVDPKYTTAYVAMGKSYMMGGEREQAQVWFKKAIAIAPNDAGLWSELGATQAQCKDWPAAIESMEKAAQMDPASKPIQTRYGLTLARMGRYEEGLNTLAKVMPEAEARYNIARMMQHNQQNDAAQVQLQLAINADPNFEPAREMLAARSAQPNYGIQQTTYQQPAPAQTQPDPAQPTAPAPVAPPRLPPVLLTGGQN
jgi:Tfp pilus assembly protein PilF